MSNMARTRILFVLLDLEAGGSERVVLDLARMLDPGRFAVYVASFGDGELKEAFRRFSAGLYIIEKKSRLDFSAMRQLHKIIRENRIDVVNAHHYLPCFYSFAPARLLNRKRLVYTEHSVAEVEGTATGFHRKILFWMLFGMHAVVGVSGGISAKFKEFYPTHAQKIQTIPNAVDGELFRSRHARSAIRERWGLQPEHFVIGTVANFRKVKNHGYLLRAAARLKDVHPQLRLLFAGTGFRHDPENSEGEVLALIHELGMQDRVVLAGYQENIPEILSAFDAFCLPSLSEGLPVCLLEAMAAGVPVMASRVRGNVEVVEDGKNGLLFPLDDIEAFAAVLEELLEKPLLSGSLAEKGRIYVSEHHDLQSWIRNYSRVFAED